MGGRNSGTGTRPNRKKQTLFCRYKPRRTTRRTVSTADVARIACAAIVQGNATLAGIVGAVEARCPDEGRRPQSDETATAVEAVLQLATVNNAALEDAYTMMLQINNLIGAIALLARVIPQARPLQLVAVPLRVAVAQRIQVNIKQRAANDEIYRAWKQIKDIRDRLAA